MKLTRLLSDLISEQVKPDGSLPIVSFVHDKFLINLSATYHQWNQRQGNKSLDEIVEIYDYNFENNPKFYERVGAPNKLIGSIFIDDFDKIKNKMSRLDLVRPNNTISVIKEVGDDLGLLYFMNYLEFIVLADDLKNYKIINRLKL
jgi:hypothetical protein